MKVEAGRSMVWMVQGSIVYHRHRDCEYLAQSIQKPKILRLSTAEAKGLRGCKACS